VPDLGTAYVNIVPKAPGIEGQIEDLIGGGAGGAERAGEGLGKRLLGGIAKLGIGVAVGKFVKDAFDAGGAMQQSFGGLDTLYGDAAAGAKEYAFQASQAGISANTYAEQAVSFGAALKAAYGGDTTAAMEAANTAIMDMADNAAKMGTPLESIQTAYQGFAKQNYTMLDNLKLGYGGTKEEMERLLADAQALTGVEYNLDNLGDVYSAIHVIQENLGLTGVAADEAKSTFTGSMAAVQASWENVMAAMTTGEGLDVALQNMSESVGNFLNVILSMLGELAPQIPDFLKGLADTVIANAPALIEGGIAMIVQLAVGLVQAIPQLIDKIPEIWDAMKRGFSTVDWGSLGVQIIQGIINGIAAAASALWQTMKNLAASAWRWAQDAFEIGSPSKLFAREVGRWIPAGIAEGIDDNLQPIDTSVRMMANSSLENVRPYTATRSGQSGIGSDAIQQLVDAISNRPVIIEGDTSKIFRVVQQENRTRTRATNYNILAAGAR